MVLSEPLSVTFAVVDALQEFDDALVARLTRQAATALDPLALLTVGDGPFA